MTVTVPVPLTSEEHAALQDQAQAQGASVDSLLRKAILQIISAAREVRPQHQLSPEELDRAFEEIAEMKHRADRQPHRAQCGSTRPHHTPRAKP